MLCSNGQTPELAVGGARASVSGKALAVAIYSMESCCVDRMCGAPALLPVDRLATLAAARRRTGWACL